MKKRIICGILSVALVMSVAPVNVDVVLDAVVSNGIIISSDTIVAHAEEVSDGVFTFRSIPWYTTKAEADAIFKGDGAEIGKRAFKNNILRMSGIDYISATSGRDRVNGGGIIGSYSGLDFDGYEASETCAAYIYTLNEDGSVDKLDDDAVLYFGWYIFDSNDYPDAEKLYDDLLQKFVSLYGDGESKDSDSYISTTTWYDTDSNQIRLLLGGKGTENCYVTLGYMAADADDRLDEMQEALDKEAIDTETVDQETVDSDDALDTEVSVGTEENGERGGSSEDSTETEF